MIVGPLLARFGKGYIPKPGGDKIGRRRLDTHFEGFIKLGAEFRYNKEDHFYGVEAKALRGMVDDLKNRMGEGIVVLGVTAENKVNLIVGVTKGLTGKVKAGELVNFLAGQVGGKGGGRPDMAQAGGDKPENLQAALDSVTGWLEDKL